jgi:hypothetical protein
MDWQHNVNDYGLELGLRQLLVAALLWTRQFESAREAADLLLSTPALLNDAERRASDQVLKGSYNRAFSVYKVQLGAGNFPSSVDSDAEGGGVNTAVMRAFLGCLRAGARGNYTSANSCLGEQVQHQSQMTLYMYGISLLSVGKRCNAYQAFRETLTATSTTTQPQYLNWASISALRAVVTLYLNHLSNSETKALLKAC